MRIISNLPDVLIQILTDLDNDYVAGKIPQGEYEAEQARFRIELASLLRHRNL